MANVAGSCSGGQEKKEGVEARPGANLRLPGLAPLRSTRTAIEAMMATRIATPTAPPWAHANAGNWVSTRLWPVVPQEDMVWCMPQGLRWPPRRSLAIGR
jgi:hypothetical protein